MKDIIYGKKVILFSFAPQDLDHFVNLHRNDKSGNMGKMCLREMTDEEAKRYVTMLIVANQIKIWSAYSKHIKHPKPIGFIYLENMTSFSAEMSGIMDYEVLRGLGKKIREGKYTYSEDASRTLIGHCFNGMGFVRLESGVIDGNRRALMLDTKVGWVREGTARKAFKLDDGYRDIILLSILKEDWLNEQKQNIGRDTDIQ